MIPKVQRPRWCSKCRDYQPWSKVRLMGARAGFKACIQCGGRTSPRKPVKFGGKAKRPPTEYKRLLKIADDLARPIAWARGHCEELDWNPEHKCRGVLQWAHGHSRVYHSLRHVQRNGRLLCAGRHHWYGKHPLDWDDRLLKLFGEEDYWVLRNRRNDWKGMTNEQRCEELRYVIERLRAGLEVL